MRRNMSLHHPLGADAKAPPNSYEHITTPMNFYKDTNNIININTSPYDNNCDYSPLSNHNSTFASTSNVTKPFMCNVEGCNKALGSASSLGLHMRNVHRDSAIRSGFSPVTRKGNVYRFKNRQMECDGNRPDNYSSKFVLAADGAPSNLQSSIDNELVNNPESNIMDNDHAIVDNLPKRSITMDSSKINDLNEISSKNARLMGNFLCKDSLPQCHTSNESGKMNVIISNDSWIESLLSNYKELSIVKNRNSSPVMRNMSPKNSDINDIIGMNSQFSREPTSTTQFSSCQIDNNLSHTTPLKSINTIDGSGLITRQVFTESAIQEHMSPGRHMSLNSSKSKEIVDIGSGIENILSIESGKVSSDSNESQIENTISKTNRITAIASNCRLLVDNRSENNEVNKELLMEEPDHGDNGCVVTGEVSPLTNSAMEMSQVLVKLSNLLKTKIHADPSEYEATSSAEKIVEADEIPVATNILMLMQNLTNQKSAIALHSPGKLPSNEMDERTTESSSDITQQEPDSISEATRAQSQSIIVRNNEYAKGAKTPIIIHSNIIIEAVSSSESARSKNTFCLEDMLSAAERAATITTSHSNIDKLRGHATLSTGTCKYQSDRDNCTRVEINNNCFQPEPLAILSQQQHTTASIQRLQLNMDKYTETATDDSVKIPERLPSETTKSIQSHHNIKKCSAHIYSSYNEYSECGNRNNTKNADHKYSNLQLLNELSSLNTSVISMHEQLTKQKPMECLHICDDVGNRLHRKISKRRHTINPHKYAQTKRKSTIQYKKHDEMVESNYQSPTANVVVHKSNATENMNGSHFSAPTYELATSQAIVNSEESSSTVSSRDPAIIHHSLSKRYESAVDEISAPSDVQMAKPNLLNVDAEKDKMPLKINLRRQTCTPIAFAAYSTPIHYSHEKLNKHNSDSKNTTLPMKLDERTHTTSPQMKSRTKRMKSLRNNECDKDILIDPQLPAATYKVTGSQAIVNSEGLSLAVSSSDPAKIHHLLSERVESAVDENSTPALALAPDEQLAGPKSNTDLLNANAEKSKMPLRIVIRRQTCTPIASAAYSHPIHYSCEILDEHNSNGIETTLPLKLDERTHTMSPRMKRRTKRMESLQYNKCDDEKLINPLLSTATYEVVGSQAIVESEGLNSAVPARDPAKIHHSLSKRVESTVAENSTPPLALASDEQLSETKSKMGLLSVDAEKNKMPGKIVLRRQTFTPIASAEYSDPAHCEKIDEHNSNSIETTLPLKLDERTHTMNPRIKRRSQRMKYLQYNECDEGKQNNYLLPTATYKVVGSQAILKSEVSNSAVSSRDRVESTVYGNSTPPLALASDEQFAEPKSKTGLLDANAEKNKMPLKIVFRRQTIAFAANSDPNNYSREELDKRTYTISNLNKRRTKRKKSIQFNECDKYKLIDPQLTAAIYEVSGSKTIVNSEGSCSTVLSERVESAVDKKYTQLLALPSDEKMTEPKTENDLLKAEKNKLPLKIVFRRQTINHQYEVCNRNYDVVGPRANESSIGSKSSVSIHRHPANEQHVLSTPDGYPVATVSTPLIPSHDVKVNTLPRKIVKRRHSTYPQIKKRIRGNESIEFRESDVTNNSPMLCTGTLNEPGTRAAVSMDGSTSAVLSQLNQSLNLQNVDIFENKQTQTMSTKSTKNHHSLVAATTILPNEGISSSLPASTGIQQARKALINQNSSDSMDIEKPQRIVRRRHTIINTLCEICDIWFKSANGLRVHNQKHLNKPTMDSFEAHGSPVLAQSDGSASPVWIQEHSAEQQSSLSTDVGAALDSSYEDSILEHNNNAISTSSAVRVSFVPAVPILSREPLIVKKCMICPRIFLIGSALNKHFLTHNTE